MKLKYYLIILYLLLVPALAMAYSGHAKTLLSAKAEKTLGLKYYYGRNGVKQNYAKAIYWLKKSAAQGNPEARKLLRKIGKK